MGVVELEDRERIAAFLRRNPQAHVYELGDLDDFDWPYTRWFGWEHAGRLEQIALLYSEPAVPVLLAIAEEPLDAMGDLLRQIGGALPGTLYLHATTTRAGRQRRRECGVRTARIRARGHVHGGEPHRAVSSMVTARSREAQCARAGCSRLVRSRTTFDLELVGDGRMPIPVPDGRLVAVGVAGNR